MNPSKLSERQAGNVERQARIVRLVIHGRGAQAQRLLEAEVLNEQQPGSTYTREPQRVA